jgi:NAD(P)-dependent dehydrogenase (short-subunit alcohol dehydrogenase family)
MKQENSSRVAVITGASSGIGRAAALKFAEEGWNLALGARRKKALDSLVDECESFGLQAVAVEMDVTDEDDVDDLAEEAISEFGHFNVWVNDAGVATVGVFDEVPIEEHRRVIETNVLGVMYGCRAALQHFRKRGEGVVINISSVLGKSSQPYHSSYVASKHAVTALGISLRQELWLQDANDIYVCTVHPESTDTPFFQHAANHSGYKFKPLPPIDTPEEVADIIYDVAMNPDGNEEAIVGTGGKVISGMQKVAQELNARQMAFMTNRRSLDRSERVREHSGALFKPMKVGTGVRGGWKQESGAGAKIAKIVGALAPLGAAAVLLQRNRNRVQKRAA